jgi:hypothetical protein
MANERRYDESEVREIFESATDAQESSRTAVGSSDGMSLTELQQIGAEVGVTPERIAQAASALDLRQAVPPAKKYLGMPLSVARTIELPRAPSDREWELLVAEIRETFGSKGEIDAHGSLRQWTNGNLQIALEPTQTGHRLRMRTLKGNVMGMTAMGAGGIGMGLFLTIALASKDRLAEGFILPIFFAVMGVGTLIAAAMSLPGWAKERGEQMEYLGARAQALLSADTEE